MFTYKFFIAKNGKLALRLRNNNKKTEINLHYAVTPDELVITLAQIGGKRGASRLKSQISYYIAVMNRIADQLIAECRMDEDIMVIRHMIEVGFGIAKFEDMPEGTFVKHFKKFIDGKTNKGTKGVYKHTLDKIRAFDPDIDKKSFEDVTLQWLTDFEAFCARTASKNARNIHLRNIRAVFNNAIDYEITTAYPFRRFKIRPEATRKRSLTVEELRKLINMEVEEYQQFYKDMFLLSFCLIGCNAVDMYGLSEITSDNRIEYTRAKTHRKYSIKVEPEALDIINKYRGKANLLCITDRWSDHRNFVHQLNKALKNMGQLERVGRGGKKIRTPAFPELSSYWCRHTWATIAYNECGISEDIIAQALGHASSHTTTSIYINRNAKLVDDANRKVLDYVFNES
jgi:integrase